MLEKEHFFHARLEWVEGEEGTTLDYEAYRRTHIVKFPGKPSIALSAAPHYHGDPEQVHAEELLTASLASSQMLTYLALATRAGIRILAYTDEAEGVVSEENKVVSMRRIYLRPKILVVAGADREKGLALVQKAHAQCFIANSIHAEVIIQPEIIVA